MLALYLVPATLYCLYNNLSFLSLAYLDPVTYSMFMQIRLLLTGLIYQVSFSSTFITHYTSFSLPDFVQKDLKL